MPPSLSVLIPVFNEQATLTSLLDAVEARDEVGQIVIVDDCSTDATARILREREFRKPVTLVRHPVNRGKGAAVRTAIEHATCDLAIIQDADLEYDPADYPALIAPFDRQGVTVVYGTRTFSSHSSYSYWYVMGNKAVTLATNVLFNAYISDMETCFKVMPVSTWEGLRLQCSGFSIEPEITGKLLRDGHRIYEVPISYVARSRAEGKKLTWRDGVEAIATLVRVRIGLL